jgi:hypothetical protein
MPETQAQILELFQRVEARSEQNREDISKIALSHASVETLRKAQDETRAYIDRQNERQSEAIKETTLLQINGARADIAKDVATQMRDMLRNWMDDEFIPAVDQRNKMLEEQKRAARNGAIRFAIYVGVGSITIGSAFAGLIVYFIK